jgi:hypothetical protein
VTTFVDLYYCEVSESSRHQEVDSSQGAGVLRASQQLGQAIGIAASFSCWEKLNQRNVMTSRRYKARKRERAIQVRYVGHVPT